jgi:diphthine synthase
MPSLRIENLQNLIGKPIRVLSRSDVEEHAEQIVIPSAITGKVGFLVAGDPMVATTHVDLRLRAHKAGVVTRIVHASSIMTAAAGVTGLQSYKFGRTITIPVAQTSSISGSVLNAITTNFDAGLHSLVLLEVDVENKCHVTIPEALNRLVTASNETPRALVKPETLAIGLARVEAPDMRVRAGTVSELIESDFGEPPYCLILPSHLHFVEAEALQIFCKAEPSVKVDRR